MCSTSQFECRPGICIPQSWTCDGEADCTNGIDEKDCKDGELTCVKSEIVQVPLGAT